MLAPVLVPIGLILAICGLLLRPRMLDRGSTPEERQAALPGDDQTPAATTVTTRAVTIGAPASAIDDASARLIVRDRAIWRRREWLFKVLVYEPLHAYMETGLLRGIKQRAEARPSTSL